MSSDCTLGYGVNLICACFCENVPNVKEIKKEVLCTCALEGGSQNRILLSLSVVSELCFPFPILEPVFSFAAASFTESLRGSTVASQANEAQESEGDWPHSQPSSQQGPKLL